MNFSNKNSDIQNAEYTEQQKKVSLLDKIDLFFAKYNYSYLAWSFILPLFLMLLIYVKMGVYPFGRSSVLVLDLNGQYVQFFAALRSAIYGDGSFLYSFGRSLGGEFLGIYAYYLASPFSYIVALFPKESILEALLTIFVLKCGSAGLSFGIFMHNSQRCNKTIIIGLSILYALSSYSVVIHHNTMWIDAMILLPLLALGVERLVKYKKPSLYVFSLALTLLCNYYLGYMSCIFVALYYFYYMLSTIATGASNPIGEKKHFWRSLLRMGVYTIIGIGIAAVMIIPAYYSLTFGKSDFTNPSFAFFSKFDFVDFLAKLFPGAYDTVRPEGLPWVYSGVIAIVLLPIYFLTKKITWQEKVASGIFIVVLFASMNINTLDMVWHGFQAPNWLNYRYSFMFSFILLILAGKAITLLREVGYKSIFASSAIIAILVVVLQKINLTYPKDGVETEYFSDINGVWFTLICLAVYGTILMLMTSYRANSPKIDTLALILVIALSVEVFLNGVYYMKKLNEDVVISSYDSYHDFYDTHQEAFDYVEETDDSEFYRVEKTFTRNVTDGFVFGINGIASSTSTLDRDVVKFIGRLGIKADSHWTEYKGSNAILDSFFGIKYILTLPEESASPIYEEYYTNESTKVYKNPYALSLAFACPSNINDISFELPRDSLDYERKDGELKLKEEFADTLWSPFSRMNAILSAIVGRDVSVYKPIEHTMKTTITVNQEPTIWNHYPFKAINKDDMSACVTFNLTASRDGNIYCFFPTKYSRQIEVFLNSKKVETLYSGNTNIAPIINLGNFSEGEALMVDMYIYPYGEFYLTADVPYFCYIDDSELVSVMTEISEGNLNITKFSDDYIEGVVNAEEGKTTILTTIPYDKGWNVKVDGKRVETYETLSCLLAFDLPNGAGEYTVTMKYYPSCYTTGIIISIASLLIFIVILVLTCLLRKGKITFKKKKALFNFTNTFIPLPTDSYSEYPSLIELEIIEEEKEKEARKKRLRKRK